MLGATIGERDAANARAAKVCKHCKERVRVAPILTRPGEPVSLDRFVAECKCAMSPGRTADDAETNRAAAADGDLD